MSDKKPDLGQNPFADEIAANNAVFMTATTSVGKANPRDLNNEWFSQQSSTAQKGIAQIESLKGYMEVRFLPEDTVSKTPKELLSAVEQSEIKTFGWPIGVTLQSRPEYRPRPSEYGIKAEVSIPESAMTGRSSYDYWALTHEGDFYLLQSFFEDMRVENALFFNTRIVRVAEAFLFGANLFTRLGFPVTTRVQARFQLKGLRGRTLASSSPNRILFPGRPSDADQMTAGMTLTVGAMRNNVAEATRAMCGPVFQLFDFAEFAPSIYDEMIQKFIDGVVT